jgi:hypothetical protein
VGLPIHSINMLDGSSLRGDNSRLQVGVVYGTATPASATAVTALGAVTAGTGYTSVPTITPTGGTGSGLTVIATGLTGGGISASQLQITNSGSYSVAPTGFTITGGGGSGAAIGAPTLGGNGLGVITGFYGFEALPPNYIVLAQSSVGAFDAVINKGPTGFSVSTSTATTVLAGTLDVLVIG